MRAGSGRTPRVPRGGAHALTHAVKGLTQAFLPVSTGYPDDRLRSRVVARDALSTNILAERDPAAVDHAGGDGD
jgi:hypothetical protein